ncbi:MAG: sulfurtransferase-like selenium metabolism protein YedF [Thermodesulfobacteriota bacterium]
MEKRVDCRGLACPQPVIETKKALAEADTLIVLVDNPAAKENVKRFAESQACKVEVIEERGQFTLKIVKQKPKEESTVKLKIRESPEPAKDLVIFIDTDSMGRGSEELGKILMRSFLQTLEQSEVQPQKVILLNSGVKLACAGSEVLEDLQELGAKGVEILACGTCLDFFGLKKNLMAGKVSNMYEIINSLAQAKKVIKI